MNNIEFWENNHKNNERYWLTGSTPEQVYSLHNILSIINNSNNLNICEIGIGLGDSIKYLSTKHNTTAIDISQTALTKVNNIAKTYLTKDIINIKDKFDLILCHLVLQHCDNDMFTFIIQNSIKLLKEDGVFSFQFAYLPNIKNLDNITLSHVNNKFLYFRTLEEVENIVSKFSKIDYISAPIIHKNEFNIHWYIIHLKVL